MTWQRIAAWAQAQRDEAIARLVGGARPELDERLRGRIQMLDELMDLPDHPESYRSQEA